MISRRLFLAGAACIAALPAWGQAGAHDEVYQTVIEDRGQHDRVIHLFGDSIMRGWGLGRFAETVPPSDPLYEFRSIASMARLVLSDSGVPVTIGYAGECASWKIRPLMQDQIIRSGDVVVIEDAGNHSQNPYAYEASWLELRETITGRHDVRCVMMTMFDYPPAPLDCQFETLFGFRTMNDATRAAARMEAPFVGQTLLVDMRSRMNWWKAATWATDQVPVMADDGIHPFVWGQMLMAGEILKASGLRRYLTSNVTAKNLAALNYGFLGYGTAAPTWRPDRAEVYADVCLRR